jgi:hypothetical protein
MLFSVEVGADSELGESRVRGGKRLGTARARHVRLGPRKSKSREKDLP